MTQDENLRVLRPLRASDHAGTAQRAAEQAAAAAVRRHERSTGEAEGSARGAEAVGHLTTLTAQYGAQVDAFRADLATPGKKRRRCAPS
jgi:hypothetical protein